MKKLTLFIIAYWLLFLHVLHSQPIHKNELIQNPPPIILAAPNHQLPLGEWTQEYLKTLKGQPSGNLRKIGERSDIFETSSSSWVNDDSLTYSFDPLNGNILIEHYRGFNTLTSAWENSYRYQNYYDANGWLIEVIGQSWNGSTWINSDRLTYTRNSLGLTTEYIYMNWSGSAWENNRRYLYSYNANNQNDIYTVFFWNNVSLTWNPDYRYLYQYDSFENISQIISQDWISSNWTNYYKAEAYYNTSNKYHYGFGYNWDNANTTWVYDFKDTVIFTSPTNTEEYRYDWDLSTSTWKNYRKQLITYHSSDIILQLVDQYWDDVNTIWVNNYQNTYTIDTQENYASYIKQDWDDVNSIWLNYSKEIYNFNTDNYQTYFSSQYWDNTLSLWEDYDRRFYWYEANPFASITDNEEQYQLNVYPNPSTNFVALKMNLSKAEDVLVTIYNLSGQQVYQKNYPNAVGNVAYFIDLNNLSNGTYVIQVQTKNEIMNKKLVKQ